MQLLAGLFDVDGGCVVGTLGGLLSVWCFC